MPGRALIHTGARWEPYIGGGLPVELPSGTGVAEPIAGFRTALNWAADYSSTTEALKASYTTPGGQIKGDTTVSLVADPLGTSRKFMLTAVPNDLNGVTQNPRMQAESPRTILEGDGFWVAQTYIFPTDWPDPGTGAPDGYLQVFQVYGEPFGGGATITLTCRANGTYDNGETGYLRWGFNRDNPNPGLAWRWKVVRNIKVDIALRVVMGRTAQTGSAEIWLNTGTGWEQQTLFGGVKRLSCVTLGEVNGIGPNSAQVQLYRSADDFPGTKSLYIGGHKIGGSLAAVDPMSYPTSPPPAPSDVVTANVEDTV